ncbi:hypothetical protein ABZ883_14715 [Streptomyces sp. NPDC046977]|uniref:hypothetical protein n=1 Tax=Streptomyces sp. NPDC046977 TaxID=3154703 RepID=UPI0033EFE904
MTTSQPTYPHSDGDVTVLGPEIFASLDGQVICWKGQNYVQQAELDGTVRQAVEYFLQSQQPDGTWECASSYTDDPEEAAGRLVRRRELMPDFTFRLAVRIAIVAVQPLPEQDASTAEEAQQ